MFYKKCLKNYKTLLKSNIQQQLGIAARSPQLMVPWTTIKMSTFSTTRQQQLVIAARSPKSAVPQTTAITSTCSIEQQQLREAAVCLPALDQYGYRHSVKLLHPWVTALREEYRPVDNASSPSRTGGNTSSPSLLPEVHIGSCRKCVQFSTGTSHQSYTTLTRPIKG